MVKYSPTRLARIFPGNGLPEYSLPYSEIAALYENGTLIRDLAGHCYRHATPPTGNIGELNLHYAEPPPSKVPPAPLIRNLTSEELDNILAERPPPPESLAHPRPLTNEQLIATAEAASASAKGSGPPARVYIYEPKTAPALVTALLAERKGSYRFFPDNPFPAGFNIPCPSMEGAKAYARILQKYGIFCEARIGPK